MLKLIFLVFGLVVLTGIVWHIGPDSILRTASQLGPVPLVIILSPMILVYGFEAVGWRLTLGDHARRVGFAQLFAIRMAGESVNVTTPAAYVGGEPLKAYLLKPYGVPFVEGLASVVTAKTTMTIAQVLFILVGIGLAFWILGASEHYLLAALVSVGLLAFGLALFMLIQRYGLAMGCLRVLNACRIRLTFLETRRAALEELDSTIRRFYTHHRRTFYVALATFFLAWMLETLEVYAILYFLDVPVDILTSVSIAALTVFIKGSTFFIPGSLGAQEGGYVLLLLAYGYPEVTGITFALIRRLREILWIGIGLFCLVLLKGRGEIVENDTPPSETR
ncbi:MAG: flippase-like domain-containing protein [Nitrospirales bacterium]|nr:flippase-like domain-containing protein [Nitrospira sp.]MDR4500149.1 flippase-like domain-containing protein [Nitrospirales bacterium]